MGSRNKNTNILVVKHDYNAGDLITILPGLQEIHRRTGKKLAIYQRLNLPAFHYDGAPHPIQDEHGHTVSMNRKMFDFLRPLLIAQDYIEDFLPWEGEQADFDFALTRDQKSVPMPHGSIHHWPMITFPQLNCDLGEPWIDYTDKYETDPYILINRTQRYYNPVISYHFLKDLQHCCKFVGTKQEHEMFCFEFGLEIEYLEAANAVDLASIIYSCSLFIGNQSFCWHLADAMKVPRLLELSPQFPNTWPTGAHGHIFAHQNSLEYFVSLFSKSLK